MLWEYPFYKNPVVHIFIHSSSKISHVTLNALRFVVRSSKASCLDYLRPRDPTSCVSTFLPISFSCPFFHNKITHSSLEPPCKGEVSHSISSRNALKLRLLGDASESIILTSNPSATELSLWPHRPRLLAPFAPGSFRSLQTTSGT